MLPGQSLKGLICSIDATRSDLLPALLQFMGGANEYLSFCVKTELA